MPFTNKIALITGATHHNGIGRAIMDLLGQAGAIVIGTATTPAGAEKITQFCHHHHFTGCGMLLDVTQPGSIETLITQIKPSFGAVNILINNAATTQDNLFIRMKEAQWLQVIETNLHSIYRLSKACIKEMLRAKWGRIINISSVVGFTGNIGQVNYVTAKAGITGFTKALAIEVATYGITVNAVAPGFIETDMTQLISDKQRTMLAERIPMQRFGQAKDVADAVAFLASADYITGQTLHVNGGMYMG